ncbi:MAG TPA: hypothetical protein VF035_08865 [Longimicrobiales bacterium]
MKTQNFLKRGGELLMIIIGVFIALVANAWWEDRSDQRLADDYRGRLVGELTRNKGLIDTLELHTSRILTASDSLLPFFEPDIIPGSQSRVVVNAYNATRRWGETFDRATFDDLMSTGNIRLLPDNDLRTALTDFYGAAKLFPRDWYGVEYRDLVRHIIPADIQLGIRECPEVTSPAWNDCPLTVEPSRARAIVQQLAADRAVVGAFRVQIHELAIFRRDLMRLNARLDSTLTILRRKS